LNNLFQLGKAQWKKATVGGRNGYIVQKKADSFLTAPLFSTKIITFAETLIFTVIAFDQSHRFYLDNG
jgi:hypothetical protein